jgi:hypothetical protein
MLGDTGLPVKLVGFAVFAVICALVAWGALISSGETVLAQNQPPSKATQPTPPPTSAPSALMNAGGPSEGPVPEMPDGRCPKEFSIEKDKGCYFAP